MLTVASCHSTQHCIFRITNEIIFLVFLENDIVLFIKGVKRVCTIFEILSANFASTHVAIWFCAMMKMWTHNSLSGSTFTSWFFFPAILAITIWTVGVTCTLIDKRIHYSSGRSGHIHMYIKGLYNLLDIVRKLGIYTCNNLVLCNGENVNS